MSMLNKKSSFKPKLANRRNATTSSAPQPTERLSKTPAPSTAISDELEAAAPSQLQAQTQTQTQALPPPAPSPSPGPSLADKEARQDRGSSTPRASSRRRTSVTPGAQPVEPLSSPSRRRTSVTPSKQRSEPTVPPQKQQGKPEAPAEPEREGHGVATVTRASPADTPTAVPEPAPTVAPSVSSPSPVVAPPLTVRAPPSSASPAPKTKPKPKPTPARARTRASQAAAVQVKAIPDATPETVPLRTPPGTDPTVAGQSQPAVSEVVAVEPAEELSEPPRTVPARGRKRKAPLTTNGEGPSHAPCDDGPAATPAPKKPRTRRTVLLPGEEGYQTAAEKRAAAAAKRTTARKRKSPSTNDGGEEETDGNAPVQANKGGGGRHREATPEDAENVEIDVTQVKMADLVKDMRVGKKFSLHDELMERERIKRQKYIDKKKQQQQQEVDDVVAAAAAAAAAGGAGDETSDTPAAGSSGDVEGAGGTDEPTGRTGLAPAGETYQIVDGVIVVDARSLQVDRHARAREAEGELEEHEENDFTHHTTSATYLRRNMRPKQWADDETDKFYWALSMFGTDFETIARMFPGKTRKHIKLKFNREERAAPARIQDALVGRKTVGMDMDAYRKHTGGEYETAEAIYAEQKKAEEEFEARQKAIQDEKDEEQRKRREALFGGGPAANGDGEGEGEAADGGKKKKGRGRKGKRAEATW